MRSALFRDFKQRRMAVYYRRFGTTYRSHLQGSMRNSILCSRLIYEYQFFIYATKKAPTISTRFGLIFSGNPPTLWNQILNTELYQETAWPLETGPIGRPKTSISIKNLRCVKFQVRAGINFYINFTNSLGKLMRRWKDNIKTDLQEMGWEGVDRSGSG